MSTYFVGGEPREVSAETLDLMVERGEIAACSQTGDYYVVDDLTLIHGANGRECGAVCARALGAHYFYCEGADIWTHHENTVQTREGRVSMAYYRDADFFTCDACGNDCGPDDYAEDGICTSCYENDRGIIRGYHNERAEETLGFFNADGTNDYRRKALYFGVELEVECSGHLAESAERVRDALGAERVIFQDDGSLSHGYEIITAPMALSVQREMWVQFGNRCSRGLTSHNTSTCGIHVHVSASAVSALQLGRVLVLINDPRNKSFIECVAQRGNGEYARKGKKRLSDARHRGSVETSHYDAVNIQGEHTIEFRLFKGNTRPDRIIKNLEFVAAVLDYCATAGASELLTAPFLAWLARPDNRKSYSTLYAFLCEKGYATPYNKACKDARSQPITEGN